MPLPPPRPGARFRPTPLRFAALLTALDAAWAAQALSEAPRHAGSNVALVSLVLWVIAHLPAAILAGFLPPFASAPRHALLSPACRWVLGLLGLGETFVLAWALARRRWKRP